MDLVLRPSTGTLISGSVSKEQTVEVYPRERLLRVRGVEVHGEHAERAVAGQRTAVNLADIEPAELTRGDVLSEPGRFRAVTRVDCRLQLLPFGEAAEASRAGTFSFRNGGNRGGSASARRRGVLTGRRGVMRGWC